MFLLRSRSVHRSRQANTLLIVLLTIAILSVVAGNLMWSASARYHTTYQSASWQESLVAAEAGVNLAMVELRKRVRGGDGTSFQVPWVAGNTTPPTGPGAATPADKRLLGGAIDPATVAGFYDPATDPSMSNPVSLTPSYPENGRALPLTRLAIHGGEGNTQTWARVYVDVPGSLPPPSSAGTNFAAQPPLSIDAFMNEQNDALGYDARTYWWYRIRSIGVAGVSGPARPSVDHRDNLLRRFSFLTDWRSNRPVDGNGPQVSRVVEAVARPLTGFRNALMADVRIDLGGQTVLVDSYNSNNGLYGASYTANGQPYTNAGSMGNIATNGTLINAGGATVKGSAMTNDGTVQQDENVTGNRSSDFYQELTKVRPAVPGSSNHFALDGKTLDGKTGAGTSGAVSFDGAGHYKIAASANRDMPTRVYLNGINLTSGPGSVELVGAADNSSTYVKLIVNGDIKVNAPTTTDGSNAIIIDNGVHAIVYVTGNVSLQGAGIANMAQAADRLLINGVQPASAGATPPAIDIQTTQDFQGIIYAPDHDLNLALQAVTTSGTGVVTKLTKAAKDQIKNLNDQIKNLNKDIDNQNKDIKHLQEDMVKNPQNTANDLQNIAKIQARIAANQTQITDLQQQINTLQGNVLPDTDPMMNDHANGYNGIYGGFIAHTIKVGAKTHVHYDEALRQAGPVNHYTITNWYEDNASHASN